MIDKNVNEIVTIFTISNRFPTYKAMRGITSSFYLLSWLLLCGCEQSKWCQEAMENAKVCQAMAYPDVERWKSTPATTKKDQDKMLYIITPTYTRPTQLAELTILASSLAAVNNVEWIVVEQFRQSSHATKFLSTCNTTHHHLVGNVRRGNLCNGLRNSALDFMRRYQNRFKDGVIHFANTDRVYSPRAFEEMRKVEHVGIWPTQRARERFTCNPELTLQSSHHVKYRLNVGSVGLSSNAVLESSFKFKIRVQRTSCRRI
ncbi:hypothetical protein ACHWQZ_G001360 [Mnemiopsis leidyi]